MKLLKRSANKRMICLGDDIKTGKWFYISDSMPELLDTIKDGEDVSITSEARNGGMYLTSLAKGSAKVETAVIKKEEVKKVEVVKEAITGSTTQKTFDENKRSPTLNTLIARQAIGHMVAETLQAMQGQVNEKNVLDLIPKLYESYKKQVFD